MQDEKGTLTIKNTSEGGGKLISIEGDAAACDHLAQYLKDKLPDSYVCQLPSAGPLGHVWRQRSMAPVSADPLEVVFGAVADAYDLAERQDEAGIIWQRDLGCLVICQEYLVGLLARYAVPHQLEDWAQHLITFLPRPDLTFYLPAGLSPALRTQYNRAITLLNVSASVVIPPSELTDWEAGVLSLLVSE